MDECIVMYMLLSDANKNHSLTYSQVLEKRRK